MNAAPVAVSKAIDPARVGLSKSLMVSPCERKGFYSETVRDGNGRRPSFPMPERVTFGTAVDEAVSYILFHDRDGTPWTPEVAIETGLARARASLGWSLVADPDVFELQVGNAIKLYVSQPDGLERVRTLYDEGLRLQGDDGETWRAGDIIGTPDLSTSLRVGDVKTWSRNDGPAKFRTSPEMGVYAYLFAQRNGGAIPDTVFYQAYVRVSKPYWLWLEQPGTAALVEYGRETAAHWRALMAAGQPELAAPNTKFCADCPFREALPEFGHEGCSIGRLFPVEEVAA
jgi:hypothetical protein